ncbi:MAG: hypothetical protein E3J76_04450, partial [Candidatus Aminicenantes bacterium]
MYWALLGALGTLLLTVIALVKIRTKIIRYSLVLIGVFVAGYGQANYYSISDREQKMANENLQIMKSTINTIEKTVGDLAILDKFIGNVKFYVVVASDTNRQTLEKYMKRIDKTYKGAISKGFVNIRDPKPGSIWYRLTIGRDLSFT